MTATWGMHRSSTSLSVSVFVSCLCLFLTAEWPQVSLSGLTSLGFAAMASLVLAATQMRSAQLQASRSAEILAAARHGRRAWAPYSRLGRRGADHAPGASARAPTLWDAQRVQRVVAGLRLLGHSLLLVGKALLLLWLRTLRPQQIMLHLVSKRRQEVTSVIS